MANNTFMDKFRSFFGYRQEPPKNDFRNPIWGSDDEDDGDELYTRERMDVYEDSIDMHRELTKQMHDIFRSFGTMFGDVKSFFYDDHIDDFPSIADQPAEGDGFNNSNIRDYYLKPGYHNRKQEHPKEDIDLDGKISSNEISGLLKQKDDAPNPGNIVPFNGDMVPGRSFCQTIITTSVTRPDGTVETRRIVKNGKEVIEETTTSSGPDSRGTSLDPMLSTSIIYSHVMSELSSLFRSFY